MNLFHLTAALFIGATAINAQPAMTGDEFDAYTRGKTFYFGNSGAPYGAEEYLDNRRVRWSYLDGKCQEGEWYQQGNMICFVYEFKSDPQCWSFKRSDAGLTALYENDPEKTELYEVEQSPDPLMCLGPDIGV